MEEKHSQSESAIWAVGTMSGTSLDGVDAAAVLTDGVGIFDFGPVAYRPYAPREQAVLRAALGCWQDHPAVVAATQVVHAAHLAVLAGFETMDLVGFHGQTFAHDPGGRGTHQAGDGAVLAEALQRPVIWDFRTADVAAGGQGAPLAPVWHFALARWIGATEPVVFLNLGGVGNLTWVDPSRADPFAEGAMVAFDTGPANAPLNDLMQKRSGQSYDKDGAYSCAGTVHDACLEGFLNNIYFQRPVPKSLDRDAFPELSAAVENLGMEDAAATLCAAVAKSVALGIDLCPAPPARMLVTGGGRQNPAIMAQLRAALPCAVDPVEAVGLDGDMLEAQAFAFMAVRALRGLAISGPDTTGVGQALSGGRSSFPTPSNTA